MIEKPPLPQAGEGREISYRPGPVLFANPVTM